MKNLLLYNVGTDDIGVFVIDLTIKSFSAGLTCPTYLRLLFMQQCISSILNEKILMTTVKLTQKACTGSIFLY